MLERFHVPTDKAIFIKPGDIKKVVYELIKQKNCKDKKLAYEAKCLLQYLKLRGIQI